MPRNDFLEQIIKIVRKEMRTYRESTDYIVIETFVGCVLAELKAKQLISSWEDSILRQKLLEE